MWQVAVAAAVAGSGLIAKHIFSPNPFSSSSSSSSETEPNNKQAQLQQQQQQNPTFFNQKPTNNGEQRDGMFRFSSSPLGKKIRVAHRKVGRLDDTTTKKKKKVTVCLKRRKTCSRNATESNCNFSLSKDCSSFGWGLGLGMICMMSAGKEDIRKLTNTIDETAKVVNELKSELNKQKSVPCHILLSSDNSGNTVDTIQKPVKLQATNESCLMRNHPIDMKLYSHLADDYASSVLTEEHQHEGAEMDQLEAELECELQKLPWCSSETSKDEDSIKMERQGMNRNSASQNYGGVHPAELGNKLSALLIEQQESHISELESELNSAYYKLQEKEAELRTLKECVRRLTEFSICTVSDEETDVQRDELEEPDHNTLVSADNACVGTKRAMLFS